MKKTIFSLLILSFFVTAGNKKNFFIGTQTFGVKYKFTSDTTLVETAKQIYNMGSDTLKFVLGKSSMGSQYPDIPHNPNINTLKKLARDEPSVKAVLDMPFNNYIIWVYPFASDDNSFTDGYTATEATNAYNEIYDLCFYLLTNYNDSGKTFYLGHWEGDWYLHPDYNPDAVPTETAINGMIDWLNVRQNAVDNAKRDVTSTNIQIYNYAEVNLVQKGIEGKKCMINDVIPNVNVDFVSYSSYDTTIPNKGNVSNALFAALNYIESKMKPKNGFTGKRVFIGEYGFPYKLTDSQNLQDSYSKDVCRTAIEWGAPFVLYWEMYCNETNSMGEHVGFWLINDQNQKQTVYYTFRNYYNALNIYVENIENTHHRLPTDNEVRVKALEILYGYNTNYYSANDNIHSLPVQPVPGDLGQSPDINISVIGQTGQYFKIDSLFNSDAIGSYGQGACLFPDGISPDNDIRLQLDFDTPKIIDEIHIFSLWGDARLFSWFDIYVSTSGTNENDYTKIGTVSFGTNGEYAAMYTNKHCVAILRNTSNFLASDITSIRLRQRNSGYIQKDNIQVKQPPGTPFGSEYNTAIGSAIFEIDIIGNNIPEPNFLFFFFLALLSKKIYK
jgi:hypothetical protein